MVSPECISLLLSHTVTPSTVNCNEQIYGRTLYLHLYSVSHLHIMLKFVSTYYIQVYGLTKLKYSRYHV